MAITRVQQGSNTELGLSSLLQVTLPDPPTGGNALLMFIATDGSVSSVETPGSTIVWTLIAGGTPGTGIWLAKNIPDGTPLVTSINKSASNQAVAVLIEYSGLAKVINPLDKTASDSGSGTTASTDVTAQTAVPEELWVAGIANLNGPTTQSSPQNGFSEVQQVYVPDARLGVYEKIVSAKGTAGTSVTLSSSRLWVGVVATLQGDPEIVQGDMDMAIAEHREMPPSDLDVFVQTQEQREAFLDIWSIAEVLTPPATQHLVAVMNMAIQATGVEVTSPMDVYIVGTGFRYAYLDIFKSLEYFQEAYLNVHVGADESSPQLLKAGMDVAVLVVPPVVYNVTTPEASQYVNCQPLWCGVPKTYRVSVSMSVNITT